MSCKALGLNPREYLNDVLGKLMDWPVNRIAELLPTAYVKAQIAETQDVVG